MEAIIESLISAGAVIIAAIISHYAATKKTNMIIEKLPVEHKDLSGEHKDLSDKLIVNKELLNRIVANQEKEEAVKQAASKNTIDLIDMAKKVVYDTTRLEEQNKRLEEKVLLSENKNCLLQYEIDDLKTQLSNERNRVKELAAENRKLKNPPEKEYDEYEL